MYFLIQKFVLEINKSLSSNLKANKNILILTVVLLLYQHLASQLGNFYKRKTHRDVMEQRALSLV